jgi:DNA repair exonuclease SbcCD nuclease subunit
VKFLHAADLHLDSPLRGLERYDGAPVEQLRGATRRAMENLVDLCLAEEVDFVVLAGDLYDGDWRDYSTALFFSAQLSRLRAANIRVYWLRGNHDAQSQITKHLKLPDNSFEFRTRKPETVVLDDLGVAIHGQGFSKRAVTDDLAAGYPDARAGYLNIGVLHTCVSGRAGHEPYAPCSVETLVAKGYDYWALGHVHSREVLHEKPWVVFPGNLQGRHVRETGAKGATLVAVEGGEIVDVAHQPLDVLRWARVEIDASGCGSGDDVVDAARIALERALEAGEGRPLAARVVVSGASHANDELQADPDRWLNAVRAVATDVEPDAIWLERIELATDPLIDLSGLDERDDAIGQLVRSLRELRHDPERIERLAASLADLRNKLPAELRAMEDPFGDEALLEAVGDVERLLYSRLLGGESR